MLPPQENYFAKFRNAQKQQRSTQDDKNSSLRNEDLPLKVDNEISASVPAPKQSNESPEKGAHMKEVSKLFGQNVNKTNLDYISNLLKQKDSTTEKPAKKPTHQRNKSSIVQTLQKDHPQNTHFTPNDPPPKEPMIVSQSMKFDGIPVEPQNNENALSFADHHPKSKEDHRQDYSSKQEQELKDPDIEQEDGGIRDSMRLESTPQDVKKKTHIRSFSNMTPGANNNDNYSSGNLKKSEKSFSKDQIKEAKKGEFIDNLDGYIKYFEDTLESKRSHQIFTPKENKVTISKENENPNEVKALKQHIEKLKMTISELLFANQNLNEEVSTLRSREDEFKIVITSLEDQMLKLKHKSRYYKAKLLHYKHILAQERADNENNLIVLKKMISNNINMALEHKVNPGKQKLYRDQSSEFIRNGMPDQFSRKQDYDEYIKKPKKSHDYTQSTKQDSRKNQSKNYDLSTFLSQNFLATNRGEEYVGNFSDGSIGSPANNSFDKEDQNYDQQNLSPLIHMKHNRSNNKISKYQENIPDFDDPSSPYVSGNKSNPNHKRSKSRSTKQFNEINSYRHEPKKRDTSLSNIINQVALSRIEPRTKYIRHEYDDEISNQDFPNPQNSQISD